MASKEYITRREQAGIAVLFFILKMINPTGYTHEINQLKEEIGTFAGKEKDVEKN